MGVHKLVELWVILLERGDLDWILLADNPQEYSQEERENILSDLPDLLPKLGEKHGAGRIEYCYVWNGVNGTVSNIPDMLYALQLLLENSSKSFSLILFHCNGVATNAYHTDCLS